MGDLTASLRASLLFFDHCHLCSLLLCGPLLSGACLYFEWKHYLYGSMEAPWGLRMSAILSCTRAVAKSTLIF